MTIWPRSLSHHPKCPAFTQWQAGLAHWTSYHIQYCTSMSDHINQLPPSRQQACGRLDYLTGELWEEWYVPLTAVLFRGFKGTPSAAGACCSVVERWTQIADNLSKLWHFCQHVHVCICAHDSHIDRHTRNWAQPCSHRIICIKMASSHSWVHKCTFVFDWCLLFVCFTFVHDVICSKLLTCEDLLF